MKKKIGQEGFALIETLIVATFVLSIFIVLIANYYPLMGKLERYSNYDETESIYIAYHLMNLIQDNSTIFNSIPNATGNNYTLITYSGNKEDSNYLCELNTYTTNKEQCERFVKLSNISKIYITNYSTKPLKNNIKNIQNVSRAFELYVKYMPSYEYSAGNYESGNSGPTKEVKLDRLIVERKIKDDKTGKNIYKYANYEIRKKGV